MKIYYEFIPEKRVICIKDKEGKEITKDNFNFYSFLNKNEMDKTVNEHKNILLFDVLNNIF